MPLFLRSRRGVLFTSALALTLGLAAPAAAEAPRAETVSGNFLAGLYASVSNDVDASADYFAAALTQAPGDPMLLENAFVLSLAAGELERAFDYARELSAIADGNRQAELALGVEGLGTGDYEAARRHLERAGVGPLARLLSEVVAAWTEAAAGDVDKGIESLANLSGELDTTFFRLFHTGLMADLDGRHDLAVESLKAAYDLDPGSLRVAEATVRAMARAGRTADALALLTDVSARAPRNPVLRQLSADLAAGRPMEPAVGSPAEGAAEILTGLGAAVARNDSWQFAALYLQLALYLDPQADLARVTLGETLDDAGQHEAALALFDGVAADSPLRRGADIQASFALNALDRFEAARDRLMPLVERDPTDIEAVAALGSVLQRNGEDEAAVDIYGRAIAALGEPQPNHWVLYYYRGSTLEQLGRWAEAEADLRTALSLNPERASVLNYLGYSLIDRGEKLDEALEMVRQAVAMQPNDGFIIDSLGWAYYRLGRYDEAVETLEQAVALKAGDPTINDHLGDAYWRVGRRLEARFQWNHARDHTPEPDQLAVILAKLKDGLPAEPAEPSRADATP